MNTVRCVSLGFLGVVLQVIAVEAKRGGGGGGGGSSSNDGKRKKGFLSSGAAIGGVTVGGFIGMPPV